jgi:hypothetical protein
VDYTKILALKFFSSSGDKTMARVSGMKEKLHMPLYDSIFVRGTPLETLRSVATDPRVLRFFVDVQNKTRLETNLQAAGVLPSMNSFETRAMRVVISSLVEGKDQQLEGNFLADFIYNSVTTLLVGEKTMIEMPTFWFPAGAGISPGQTGGAADSIVQNHGEPSHLNSFRFAEPVFIESQQNFRVEIAFPRDIPTTVGLAYGPFHIWVVLDGYLTRDVQ